MGSDMIKGGGSTVCFFWSTDMIAIALGFVVADAVFHENLGAHQGKTVTAGNTLTLGKIPKLEHCSG